jgi:hypothetical protein
MCSVKNKIENETNLSECTSNLTQPIVTQTLQNSTSDKVVYRKGATLVSLNVGSWIFVWQQILEEYWTSAQNFFFFAENKNSNMPAERKLHLLLGFFCK